MLTNADRAQQTADRLARARAQREDDVRRLMEAPWGRRLLAAVIFDIAGLERVSLPDPGLARADLLMAFNDGRRSVGYDLRDDLKRVAPAAYAELAHEWLQNELLEASLQAAHAVPKASEH